MWCFREKMTATGYGPIGKPDFDATTSVKTIKYNKFGDVGKILFHAKSACNAGVVAHELAHAILYWYCARIQEPLWSIGENHIVEINKMADEIFAEAFSRAFCDYWVKFHENNAQKMYDAVITH